MKLRTILETINDQLQTLAQRHQTTPELIKKTTQEPNQKYWKWTLKQWYDNKIRLPEDGDRVKETLENYQKALPRIPNNQKDIANYQTLSQIEAIVEPLLGIKSSTKTHNDPGQLPGVELISKQGPYETYSITDPGSLKKLGEGTKWCTRGSYSKCQANRYLKSYGELFIIFQNGRPVVQYTPDFEEIQDINNHKVNDPKLLDLIPPPRSPDAKAAYRYARDVIKGRWPEAEPIIMKDPEWAFNYVRYIKGRWPEAEPYIMKIPEWAYGYAKIIIKGRWPEAEPYIMKDPEYAYNYARYVIENRWPEAEPIIMKDPQSAFNYAESIIRGRWPEAEPYIMKDPESAFNYARDVIRGRWPEAEPIIKKDPRSAHNYARFVIKGRWPEAEPYIMKDPQWAHNYARFVIKGRWPEAEPYIMKDPKWAKVYDRSMVWASLRAGGQKHNPL